MVSENEPDKVVCRIEIVGIEKWNTNDQLNHLEYIIKEYGLIEFEEIPFFHAFHSGFTDIDSFIQYHRDNYAPVKFAHTFELVKGDNI